jgi:hypothetical protein
VSFAVLLLNECLLLLFIRYDSVRKLLVTPSYVYNFSIIFNYVRKVKVCVEKCTDQYIHKFLFYQYKDMPVIQEILILTNSPQDPTEARM